MLPPTSLLFLSTLTAVTAVCGLTIDPRNNDGGGKQTDGDAARKCAAFKVWQPDFVELTKATYYPANAHIDIKQTGGPLSADDLPAFCRLELVVNTDPSVGQKALAEVWLPTQNYNNRLLAVGNGGYAGVISYGDLAGSGLRNGFAAVSTNTGHDANAATGIGGWAAGNPAAIIDFAGRALHMSTVAAKAIVEGYYGSKAKKSYYSGCSTGGRQGLTEAQYYPEDFDGILAGAPANHWSHLMSGEGLVRNYVLPINGSSWLTDNDWALVEKEVLKQCDGIDGVMDNVIQNPRLCQFRPETLMCSNGKKTETCLGGDQISALNKIYSNIYGPNSQFIWSRFEPGTEARANRLFGVTPFPYPAIWYQYFIYNTTDTFNTSGITFEDVQRSDQIVLPELNATNVDFRAFQDRGGKFMMYHGFADELIAPANAIHTYNDADVLMKEHGRNLDDMLKFYTVPGMGHCRAGSGACAFGASSHAASGQPALKAEPKYDMLLALVDWVEKGKVPGEIVATKYKNNNATQGVEFTRPLCKYPAQSKYKGKGDASKAENWYCAYPPPF